MQGNIKEENNRSELIFSSNRIEEKHYCQKVEEEEEYLEISHVKSTRRLLIIGKESIDNFLSLLRKATTTPFKVENGQDDMRRIVFFRSSVKTSLIQNVLQSSDNSNIRLLVSKSTSNKRNTDFLSLASSSSSFSSFDSCSLHSRSSYQQKQQEQEQSSSQNEYSLDYITQLILQHSEWQQLQDLLSHVRNSSNYNAIQQAKLWLLISQNKQDILAIFALCSEYQANQKASLVQFSQQLNEQQQNTYNSRIEQEKQYIKQNDQSQQIIDLSSSNQILIENDSEVRGVVEEQESNEEDSQSNKVLQRRNNKAYGEHVVRIRSCSVTPTKHNNHTNKN